MGKYHDRHAKEPPKYSVGDLVMLHGKNLKPRRPSRNLDAKLHGPFNVLKVRSPTAIQLELPNRWRIHNAFHVSLIEPYRLAINIQDLHPSSLQPVSRMGLVMMLTAISMKQDMKFKTSWAASIARNRNGF
jgi:hypothetical protein